MVLYKDIGLYNESAEAGELYFNLDIGPLSHSACFCWVCQIKCVLSVSCILTCPSFGKTLGNQKHLNYVFARDRGKSGYGFEKQDD